MPVEENRWRYKVTAESMSLESVEPRSVPKISCNGGPIKRANSESEGQLRPRRSSACFRHATTPSRGSVSVPSRSNRTFTIRCCHKIKIVVKLSQHKCKRCIALLIKAAGYTQGAFLVSGTSPFQSSLRKPVFSKFSTNVLSKTSAGFLLI